MRLYFKCPCGAVLDAPEGRQGSAGECPACGRIVVVPEGAMPIEDGFLTDAVARQAAPEASAAVGASAPDQVIESSEWEVIEGGPEEPAPKHAGRAPLGPPVLAVQAPAGVKSSQVFHGPQARTVEARGGGGSAVLPPREVPVDPDVRAAAKASVPSEHRAAAAPPAAPVAAARRAATSPAPKEAVPSASRLARGAGTRPVPGAGPSRMPYVLIPALGVLAAAVVAIALKARAPSEESEDLEAPTSAGAPEQAAPTGPSGPPSTGVPAPGAGAAPVAPAPPAADAAAEAVSAAKKVDELLVRGEFDSALAEARAALARLGTGPGTEVLTAAARRAEEAIERKRTEEAFAAELARIGELARSGRLEEALGSAKAALAAEGDERRRDSLSRLVAEIEAGLARAASERERLEREAKLAEAVAAGESALAVGAWPEALAAFELARSLGAQVDGRIAVARAGELRARGEAAEKSHDAPAAIEAYRKACELVPDDELAARIRSLEKGLRLDAALGEIETAVAARPAGVRALVESFLKEADAPRAERARVLLRRAEDALAAAELVRRAEGALREGSAPRALELAEKALRLAPGDAAVKKLVSRAQAAVSRPPREVTDSIGIKLVLVPEGRFAMGSEAGAKDERPAREVRLGAYYIGVHEVTNAQFELFRPEHRKLRDPRAPLDDCPVTNVTWDEARAFCEWLSEKEGFAYRLPTEAEWERAARGDSGSRYPWGEDPPVAGGKVLANCLAGARGAWKRDGFQYAAPVGSFPEGRSPFGVLDMAGNVAEWCADWYSATSYRDGPAESPAGPEKGTEKVVRGGSWNSPPVDLRSARRSRLPPKTRSDEVGFRVVREVFKKPG